MSRIVWLLAGVPLSIVALRSDSPKEGPAVDKLLLNKKPCPAARKSGE